MGMGLAIRARSRMKDFFRGTYYILKQFFVKSGIERPIDLI